MKHFILLFIFLSSFASASSEIVESLGEVKLNKTTGKVFLSGVYQANGRFKCDDNFLSGGRIYFTLGKDDYSYTLTDVLGHPDLLRKQSRVELRGLASDPSKWKITTEPYLGGKRFTFTPTQTQATVKKINVTIDSDKSMKSLYLDFGSHNLSFFAT
jgi:hypothetical protein